MTHKLSWICALLAIGVGGCRLGGRYAPDLLRARPGDRVGIGAVQPAPSEMTALVELVRAALAANHPPRPSEVSAALSSQANTARCRAHVTLRDGGRTIAYGTALFDPLPRAFAGAVRELLRDRKRRGAPPVADPSRLAVECELSGPAEFVPLDGAGHLALEEYFEPGIHGIGLRAGSRWWEIRPSQIGSSEWGSHRRPVLPILADLMNADARAGGSMLDAPLAHRFASTHFWQPRAGRPTTQLVRGLVPVAPEDVNPAHLDQAIGRLGDFLIGRQRDDGLFRYEYRVVSDEAIESGNWVRQAGATWVLCQYARYSARDRARQAAQKALDAWMRALEPLELPPEAACINTGDDNRKLGTTALVLLALIHAPDVDRFATQRNLLINAILSQRNQDGSLLTHFPPAEPVGSQYYYPGEALLALAHAFQHKNDDRITRAFASAHSFYRDLFKRDPVPAFVPWQAQAHARMYLLTGRRKYAEFVLEMTDWIADMLIGPADSHWPDLYGGIQSAPGRPPGINTASYLEGFTDALELARKLGDAPRAQRYEHLVRSSARFVLQLIVKPQEAFFHTRPEESVWGVRSMPTDHHLRIDHVQHALAALMKTRTVLFGPPPPPDRTP